MQGDKVTAKIGGNLHIETLQEKETYEEKNTSAGFDLSWDIRAGKFSKPTFGLSAGRGTIDSHYRSARGQSGIFAGKDGFDIYVEKNTDLKGAVIASEADAGKNRLSTGTFSFSDLENGADYSAKDYGISVQTQRKRQLTGKIHSETGELEATEVQELNIHPSVSIPLRGHASSTTKSAVAAGAIDIRENPGQDISALDRDMQNTLNELDRIFHRSDIKEKQEWIGILSSEGYRMIGDYSLWHYKEAIKEAAKHEKGSEAYKKAMKEADRWQDGGAYKTMLHASFGGLLSSFSGASFSAGAITGTVNELMIKELQNIKSPELKQAFSLIAGAAIGKMAGDSPWTEAAIAEQATQNNFLIHEYQVKMAYALKEALDSGDHQRILNVVAYFAALSSYSMKHPTRAEQLDWVLLNGPIEPLLLKQLMRIDNPNDSIHASDMINDALNRIVTSTYGWEATLLANLYFSRLENGFYQHDGFTIPDEAFHRLEWEQPRLLQKIYAQEMAKLAATEPKEYVQRVYQNGGYWNDSGILVDNGEERPYFLQRGDYEYQYNHLPIAGHFPDGTPYIRAEKGDGAMADWPVWSAPRAEIRNPSNAKIHESLDILGYVPGLGTATGLADSAVYLIEKDYPNAALAAVTSIPGAKYAKLGGKIREILPSLTAVEKLAKEKALLGTAGKFKDAALENGYLAYIARKNQQGKPPRDRIDWKEAYDYWLHDSPMARGNAFNNTANKKEWYPYNEIHLTNGKRLDSYDPVKGEIVSRKATDLEMIDMKTFERYLKELRDKYPPGTKIRSNTHPKIDGQELHGKQILEIPASNKNFERIDEYIAKAEKEYGIEIRFREE